jgi:DNA-binding NtrC family response regulator
MLAALVHAWSARNAEPFISVNMGSISEALFESEMFGHVKGAFTDAKESRTGRFELVGKGTLFLDEIGNTPHSQQTKLLRVLEARQFEKVGASTSLDASCRLICATNCNLDQAVALGEFRMDLLYRINTLTFRVPGLQERKEDILPLAKSFIAKHTQKYGGPLRTLSDAACEALLAYKWPGNVRELSHVMERVLILSTNELVLASDLGLSVRDDTNYAASEVPKEGTLETIERLLIKDRIQQYQGNWVEIARSLGLSKSAFYRRLEKYRLNK